MPMDPVCACEVDKEGAEYKSEYEGKTFYFCTAGCKAKFDAHPKMWAMEQVRAETSQ